MDRKRLKWMRRRMNMEKIDYKKLSELADMYAGLGHLIDALWYVELEKEKGFETAYKVDEAVWIRYSRKEARKLKKILGFDIPTFEDIEMVLKLSLFKRCLNFELVRIGSNPLTAHFLVISCRTLTGMQKMERGEGEIYKICKGIGIAFFEGLLKELVPEAQIKCLYCPHGNVDEQIPENVPFKCGWEFILPGIK
jgi:uncharacterized protein DUF6125